MPDILDPLEGDGTIRRMVSSPKQLQRQRNPACHDDVESLVIKLFMVETVRVFQGSLELNINSPVSSISLQHLVHRLVCAGIDNPSWP